MLNVIIINVLQEKYIKELTRAYCMNKIQKKGVKKSARVFKKSDNFLNRQHW